MNLIFKIKLLFTLSLLFMVTACSQKLQTKQSSYKAQFVVTNAISEGSYPSENTSISTHSDFAKTHYPKKIVEFKKNPLEKNDIVFLGNSITEQGGDWGKRLNNSKVKNRGISGDTTDGVLARLGEIINCKPTQVFILIGINDLFREEISSKDVFKNILKIVKQIHLKSPTTKIFVHTILPTTTLNIKNKIQNANILLKNAETKEPFQLIDLHNEFTDKDGLMDSQLSIDGVHLNEEGYNIWSNKIMNLIHI